MAKQLQILYEDNHVLGVFKRGGLLAQGDKTGDDTALAMAKRYVKDKYNKPGDVFIGLVHRIDRPVSGVMLFARTSKAASRLSREFQARRVDKTYLAVVRGKVSDDGELVSWLERVRNKSRVVSGPSPDAREAILSYSVLESGGDSTLLEIRPATGRHHQIRVQFAEIGHPVAGDMKYGAGEALPDKTIALHAARISVKHPTRDEIITLEAPPPWSGPWLEFPSTIENYFETGE